VIEGGHPDSRLAQHSGETSERGSPAAILKRKAPGIIDTTEAKPTAANGICHRRATGVRINPTVRQATIAPPATPTPRVRIPQRKDCHGRNRVHELPQALCGLLHKPAMADD
jgi:hypothetical protein